MSESLSPLKDGYEPSLEPSSQGQSAHGGEKKEVSPPAPHPAPRLPPSSLFMPCGHDMNGRNLIVCIDGTSNQFGDNNTNVIELYRLLLKNPEDKQKTWYNSGIGTYAQPSWKSLRFFKQAIRHKIDLAIAWNFERAVLAAYRWLSAHYKPGDTIFLFGFSRGAFQIRVLAGMIDKVGLIFPGNEEQIPFAFELYADRESDEPIVSAVGSSDPKPAISKAEQFKSTFAHKDVKVHFVGAWDTVSSIGVIRGTHLWPRTVDGMKHVCYFRHALALDERRVKFLPEYAYGGTTLPPSSKEDTNKSETDQSSTAKDNNSPTVDNRWADDPDPMECDDMDDQSRFKKHFVSLKLSHTKETWFAGTHSDIGGGNIDNPLMDRSRPPLRWMVFEAGAVGLRTAPFPRDLSGGDHVNIIQSLTPVWWTLELLPVKRLAFTQKKGGKSTTRKPHLGAGRQILPGQRIHSSLLLADQTTAREYTPRAHPPENETGFWDMLHQRGTYKDGHRKAWLELDLYEVTPHIVEGVIKGDDHALGRMRHIATSAEGRRALYKEVTRILKNASSPDHLYGLMQNAMQVLSGISRDYPPVVLIHPGDIHHLVSSVRVSENEGEHKIMRKFLLEFTDLCSHVLQGHADWATSVAFSPDGKCVASGSEDKTIRIWSVETGKVTGEPLQGHSRWVTSVAFSPDGECIVSGSDDKTVRIWSVGEGKTVRGPLRGHAGSVTSVAFSPDCKCVASGSDDETIRIWDAETGQIKGEPLRGHAGCVTSVAFSTDGKRVVSGSHDKTVRIWSVETGKMIGEALRGHVDTVTSVAFSPDNKFIVSGSNDDTVQIWSAETGKMIGKPLRGHTDSVTSVALSPDGKYIASGSEDETVRIWNAGTGQMAGEPLRGHTDVVTSVAFSPDSKSVVSGSGDKTVRIWDDDSYTV